MMKKVIFVITMGVLTSLLVIVSVQAYKNKVEIDQRNEFIEAIGDTTEVMDDDTQERWEDWRDMRYEGDTIYSYEDVYR